MSIYNSGTLSYSSLLFNISLLIGYILFLSHQPTPPPPCGWCTYTTYKRSLYWMCLLHPFGQLFGYYVHTSLVTCHYLLVLSPEAFLRWQYQIESCIEETCLLSRSWGFEASACKSQEKTALSTCFVILWCVLYDKHVNHLNTGSIFRDLIQTCGIEESFQNF